MTRIEWCDETWNPIVGCAAVSPGCAHCYAAGVARRSMQPAHVGLVNQRGHWTGEVRCLPDRLAEPLHWRKPRRVFVCSMSDLFHDDVPDEFIDRVWARMLWSSRHTFQILTKRPERIRAYLESRTPVDVRHATIGAAATEMHGPIWVEHAPWPLPNVWLGVSCEDQQRANERIPLLLQTPAVVRFVSAEPLLGPIDLEAVPLPDPYLRMVGVTGVLQPTAERDTEPDDYLYWQRNGCKLNWVIVGGESGPGARPCDVAWIRSIVEQCRAAGVPAFVKQLGANVRASGGAIRGWPTNSVQGLSCVTTFQPTRVYLPNRKGADPAEWPADLRVREWPA